MKIEFTEQVRIFLQVAGYSHIYSAGIANPDANSVSEDIWDIFDLVPLHSTDPRINDDRSEGIETDEVMDMAQGIDTMVFLVDMDDELYLNYITKTTIAQ